MKISRLFLCFGVALSIFMAIWAGIIAYVRRHAPPPDIQISQPPNDYSCINIRTFEDSTGKGQVGRVRFLSLPIKVVDPNGVTRTHEASPFVDIIVQKPSHRPWVIFLPREEYQPTVVSVDGLHLTKPLPEKVSFTIADKMESHFVSIGVVSTCEK